MERADCTVPGKSEQLEVVGREHREMVDRSQSMPAARRQLKPERGKSVHRLVYAVAHVDDDMIEDRQE